MTNVRPANKHIKSSRKTVGLAAENEAETQTTRLARDRTADGIVARPSAFFDDSLATQRR